MITPSTAQALKDGDQLLEELRGEQHIKPPGPAPTMGLLQKVRYTHKDMIDYIISNPTVSQGQIAARYGYTQSWISNILASDAFQEAMAGRREEIIDPELKASIEERFRALVIQSLARLQEKLNAPQVSDLVAIRCAELGAKALGVGGHQAPRPPENSQDRLERLAARLITLQGTVRKGVADGEIQVLELQQETHS